MPEGSAPPAPPAVILASQGTEGIEISGSLLLLTPQSGIHEACSWVWGDWSEPLCQAPRARPGGGGGSMDSCVLWHLLASSPRSPVRLGEREMGRGGMRQSTHRGHISGSQCLLGSAGHGHTHRGCELRPGGGSQNHTAVHANWTPGKSGAAERAGSRTLTSTRSRLHTPGDPQKTTPAKLEAPGQAPAALTSGAVPS